MILIMLGAYPIMLLRTFPNDKFESDLVLALLARELPYFLAAFWMFGLSDSLASSLGLYGRAKTTRLDTCSSGNDDDFISIEKISVESDKAAV